MDNLRGISYLVNDGARLLALFPGRATLLTGAV